MLIQAVARASAPGDADVRADLLSRLSRVHMRLEEEPEGWRRLKKPSPWLSPWASIRAIAEAWINKSGTLSQMRCIREALLLMRGAVELADEVGDIDLRMRAHRTSRPLTAPRIWTWPSRLSRSAGPGPATGIPGPRGVAGRRGGHLRLRSRPGLEASMRLLQDAIEDASGEYILQLFLGIDEQFLTMRGEDRSDVIAAQRRILETAGFAPFQRFHHDGADETLLSGRAATRCASSGPLRSDGPADHRGAQRTRDRSRICPRRRRSSRRCEPAAGRRERRSRSRWPARSGCGRRGGPRGACG